MSGDLEAVRKNLASLNEIIAEMTAKVSDDPEFTVMTVNILRDHSWALGFKFRGQATPDPRDGRLPSARVADALDVARLYARTQEPAWVIDQMVRALTGASRDELTPEYLEFTESMEG